MGSLEQANKNVRLFKIGGFIVPVITNQSLNTTTTTTTHIVNQPQQQLTNRSTTSSQIPAEPKQSTTTTGTQYTNQSAFRHHDYDKFARGGNRLNNELPDKDPQNEPVFNKKPFPARPKKYTSVAEEIAEEDDDDDDDDFSLPNKPKPRMSEAAVQAEDDRTIALRHIEETTRRENTKRFERLEQLQKTKVKTTPRSSDGSLFTIRGTTKRVIEVTTTEVDDTNQFMVMEPVRMQSFVKGKWEKRTKIRENRTKPEKRKLNKNQQYVIQLSFFTNFK
jgi:hypothetical protein